MLQTLGSSLISGLLLGGVYAAMAVGFSMALGMANTLNLAHAAIVLVSTYLAYVSVTLFGIDSAAALIALVPVMFLVGHVLYRHLISPTLRRSDDATLSTAMLTLGLTMILENVLSLIFSPTAKMMPTSYSGQSVSIFGILVQVNHLVAFGLSVVCVLLVYLVVHQTMLGKAMQALAQNRDGARLQGIREEQVSALAFAIGTATTAVAGVASSLIWAFTPNSHFEWLLWVLLVVVIAGAGTVRGTLYAGLIIGSVIGITGALLPNIWLNLVLFGSLIVVLLLRPTGLFRT